jgi:hypothetical protein
MQGAMIVLIPQIRVKGHAERRKRSSAGGLGNIQTPQSRCHTGGWRQPMELKLKPNSTDSDMIEVYLGPQFRYLAAVINVDNFDPLEAPEFHEHFAEGESVIAELKFKRVEE